MSYYLREPRGVPDRYWCWTATRARRRRDADLLIAPVGRLHFAGEHTAGAWSGLMEGAPRSGLRAAAEVAMATTS